MVVKDENALSRWSRRKLVDAQAEVSDQAVVPASPELTPAEDQTAAGETTELALPDIDSLDAESDFSVFMQKGVPEELQRLALRKLWSSDPVYANLDGLNDYDPGHVTFLEQISEAAQQVLRDAYKASQKEKDADGPVGAEEPTSANVRDTDVECAESAADVAVASTPNVDNDSQKS